MIDIAVLAVFGATTYLVASEGAWGAASTLVAAILSGLVAMNYFEPAAETLQQSFPAWRDRFDVIAMLGLFAGGVALMRVAVEKIQPTDLPVEGKAYDVVRWLCGAGTGYVVAAIALTAFHTAPLAPGTLGFHPERDNVFGDAPDRRWLAHVHHLSETSYRVTDASGRPSLFDGPTFPIVAGGTPETWPTFPIRYASRNRINAGVAQPPGSGGLPSAGGRRRQSRTASF